MTAPLRNNNVIDPFSWDKNVIDFKGYNGSPNLKKAGVITNFTQEMIDEWKRCKDDIIYFAERYIKIIHVDKGLIPIQLYDYQKEIIENFINNRRSLAVTGRQQGKALSLETEIPLFSGGFKNMGDIKVGDIIIGNDGLPTNVTFVSEIHNKPTYKITFSDSSTIDACEDHLWEVCDSWQYNKLRVLTTKEISENYRKISFKKTPDGGRRQIQENKYYIQNTSPIQYEKRDLLIDPYVLGVWLGDGESASGRLTCHVDDKQEYEKQGISFTTEKSHSKRKNIWTSTIVGLHTNLKKYNLIKNKHIPEDYLYSCVEDRISLLQGLLDTDGYISSDGQTIEFTQSSDRENMIMSIKQLMESLGLTVRYSTKYNKKYDKNYLKLTCSISREQFVPFRLERKISRLNNTNRKSSFSRYITNIEQIDIIPTKCLTVDNDNHMFLCGHQFIPTHNTTTATVIILHFVLFNEYKLAGLLANKGEAALEILNRIQLAYEYLPKWMQPGVVEWNKGSIELGNGCKIIASATSGSSIRGKSCAMVYLDEAAFIENFQEFWSSTYPTISSGETTKLLFTSTPKGLNHFYKFVIDAKEGRNGFAWTEVKWNKVPGRDEKWKQETLQALSFDYEQFAQEYECEFMGSSGTLVSGAALKTLVHQEPIYKKDGFNQYVIPDKSKAYVILCDVSRGKGLDYSAFSVIDVSVMPYVQVATYKSNVITPTDYAFIINKIGLLYNTASVLIELNDIGAQVADILFDDYDYDNLLFTMTEKGRNGKSLCGGGSNADRGVRTTTAVKAKGCSILKLLIEQQQLIINDFDTINELSRFSKKGKSYEAEDSSHDDMVMGLVLFSWMTTQPYFSNITDINTLHNLRDEDAWDDFVPFGYILDGSESDIEVDNEGRVWMHTDAWHMNY